MNREKLTAAERLMAERVATQRRIERQKELIAVLENAGLDSKGPKEVLKLLEETLARLSKLP